MSQKLPCTPPLCGGNGSQVYIIPGLQEEERAAVKNRSVQVLSALKGNDIQAEQVPVIAMLGSGGGLRAHIACLGVLSEMRNQGLLGALTYLAGVSGSTWAMSSFYTKDGNTEDTEAELKQRFDNRNWDWGSILKKTVQSAKANNYSLTHFWAYLVVTTQTREVQESALSSMKTHVDAGTLPYPIFAAIDKDLLPAWKEERDQNTWFEFTPHHAGYPALGAYVATTRFGSQFENGTIVQNESEQDLTFLRGLWGSALGSFEEIKEFIWNKFRELRQQQTLVFGGMEARTEVPVTDVVEMFLDLVMAYIKDPKSPSIQQKLRVLQQELEAQRRDEAGEPDYSWMTEVIERWSEIHLEDQEQFLKRLANGFVRQEMDLMHEEMKTEQSTFLDYILFLFKTAMCLRNWEWGTTFNFLYQHGSVTDQAVQNREHLHLMDAGVAINTPYPLVLTPARQVHLILSFDFSAGDAFETLRATADYCQRHSIPFPAVEEAKLKEWSKAPKSCYVLRGTAGPVVMHFPLFNTDTCEGDLQSWQETYRTFQPADNYTVDKVTKLLDVAKTNVSKNVGNIVAEMRKVARDLQKFPPGVKEDCSLMDTLGDVQAPGP